MIKKASERQVPRLFLRTGHLDACCFDIGKIRNAALSIGVVAGGENPACAVQRDGMVASGGDRDNICPIRDIALSVAIVADCDHTTVLF